MYKIEHNSMDGETGLETQILKLDVVKIYVGRQNCCRCGCGGNYHLPGSVGFTKAFNKFMRSSDMAESIDNYIFEKDTAPGRCITLYLEEEKFKKVLTSS